MSQEEPEGPEPAAAAGGPSPAGLGGDEPPCKEPDRPCAEPVLGPGSSRYFASLDATVEGLQQQVRDLIGRINEGREEDHRVLSGFRESLMQKVSPERAAGSRPFPPGHGESRYSARLGGRREAQPGRGGSCGARPGGAPRAPAGAAAAASGPASSGPRCPPDVPPLVPTLPSRRTSPPPMSPQPRGAGRGGPQAPAQMAARPGSCGPR
ncbi:synaptonemal complex central element protein 2 isoform 1-T2 [Cyanocitta cristata]